MIHFLNFLDVFLCNNVNILLYVMLASAKQCNKVSRKSLLHDSLAVLLVYLPCCLGRRQRRPFRSSSPVATCYYQSNHSEVKINSINDLPKNTISELTDLSLFYANRHVGKL